MQQTIEGFRLSPQQARLWLLQQQSNAYRASCSLVIEGHLHIPTLRQALEAVFRRHEVYRTSFWRLPGVKLPVQVVNTSPLYVWSHCDIRTCLPEDQQKLLGDLIQEARAASFDLERGPFAQCTLFTLHEKRNILFVNFHALYADASTLYHFVEEVTHFYKNNVFSRGPDVQDAQYLHFSEWQNNLLEEEGESISNAYWHDKYQAAFFSLTFPFEHKNSERIDFSPASLAFSIDTGIYTQIEALLEKQQCPLSVFLLACWQILLWRLTGREDLLIGLGVDGRIYEQLADIAGLIAKDMPFVCHLTEDLSFGKLLTQTHETTDELLSLYPSFSWEALGTATSTAAASLLYPFGFDFREQPTGYESEAVSFSLQQCYACYEPFKVKLIAVRSASSLTIEVHYDANLFDARDIQRVACQFTTLVDHAVKHPEARISELNMLSPVEQKQLLVELNQMQTGSSWDLCLHQLFERQVASTPDAVAVYDDEKQLTYRGLDGWANRVAQHLQKLGVQAEVLVGVYLQHSVEFLVSILGILKAGGAYVPLDRGSPRKRLASIAVDASLSVLLTTQHFLDDMFEIEHIVCLDMDWGVLAQYSGETPPVCNVLPMHLAYVLYTSGSTGQPKGVMISHEGLVHYVSWASERYEVAAGAGTPLHSSLAFDLTVTSLFPSLVVGRSVWLVAQDAGVEELANALRTRPDFSLVKLTPAHLDLLNQLLTPGELAGTTRLLIVGGDALRAETLATWRLHTPETRLINEYGPTETVVGCCIYEVPPADMVRRNVPIGRPIANTQMYLLDWQMQPVPWGVVGEVYIGGIGLGRGYLHRADITAERFVPHPFSSEPGARLYRTGDLACYISADGDLEYVGRIDQQIKVRGYRVELGEIEVVLARHPAVRECVVLAHEDTMGDQQLVAYVVSMQPEAQPPMREWREYLQELLPSYMVPASFVLLKALPLMVNGKVDRLALPAPESQPEEKHGMWGAPRTALQEILAELWCEVLGRSQINVYDNFFELGGHSLLATRLIARVQAVFQVELPVQAVFDQPTIAGLAQQVEQVLHKGEGIEKPPLVAVERPEEIPLSFAQQRLWFIDQLEPDSTAYLAPYVLRLRGELNAGALEKSLGELVCRHESLRTTFEMRAGQTVQVIHPAGRFMLPVIDLQGLSQEQREQETKWLAKQEAQLTCNLTIGPLMRTYLLRMQSQEHILLLTLHHIITDGWSNEVLVHELTILYQVFLAGQPSPLAPLPIQYADYALWQRQWLQGEVLEAQLAYWRKQLAHVTPLALPTDHPRLPEQTYRGAVQSQILPGALYEDLVLLSQQENVTVFMLLLTAFQVLLLRYTGQTDISVGVPIANRTRAEIAGVIGFFVNTLVLRTDLSGNPTFLEGLQQVREVCLQAYAHQDVPFEKLVEVLQPERGMSRSPLFQVSFQLAHVTAPSQLLPGLRLEPLENDGASADDDLRIMMIKSQQGFSCTAFYNSNLFEAQTIDRFLEHFQILLQGIVLAPGRTIALLPLLCEQERHMLQVEWNATQADYPQDLCVHQLFERQVEQTPDAVALVAFEDMALTYAELNRRANQLAHYLQSLGVGPEVLVGICLERCIEMIVGLLGVFKAGGAYVPLDPSYPDERLAFMVADAHISVLLTQQRFHGNFPLSEAQVIVQEQVWERLACEPDHNPISRVSPENLAYSIYTSGSTGIPKGVLVTHRGLGNLGPVEVHAFAVKPSSRVLQFASLSFDVSISEILVALLAGASLHLERTAQIVPGPDLLQVLQKQAISLMMLIPSALAVLPAEDLPALQTVITGGESCPVELMVRWAKGRHFFNTYGPTEATVCASMTQCSVEQVAQSSLSLGRPLVNTQLYVLDREMKPAPLGIPGELYLGGIGLARGYFNRPELTAERFVPHPFSTELGARLYRTGDLARYRPDGNVEFLGRIDHQVKLRGYRIELGEIETVLRGHEAVQDCIVVKREEPLGNEQLVAYVVTQPQDLMQQVRRFLDVQAHLAAEQLKHWQQLYDETYRQRTSQANATFDLVGWNSSYTGQPIPVEEMQVWLEDTLALVQAYHPERVLEIGCGSGLLLFRLAPICKHYYGTDFSASALERVHQQLAQIEEEGGVKAAVTVLQRQADDFSGFMEGQVDTVLLNSVVQYFPDVNYLLRVLEGALHLVAPGGRIIVGDVRSLPLLEAFHASVLLYCAQETLTRQQLWQQVQWHLRQEEELVIAPAFFRYWAQTTGRVCRMEVRLKRGWQHNELTQFRYQVVLHIGEPVTAGKADQERPTEKELNWSEQAMTLELLSEELRRNRPSRLRLLQVPNARVNQAIQTLQWLKGHEGPEMVGHWRAELSARACAGIEPEDLWEQAEQLGYHVTINWEHHKDDGSYAVLLERGDNEQWANTEEELVQWEKQDESVVDWQCFTNQPLRRDVERLLVSQMREYLQEQLPDYMVPANLVVLAALPLMPNGKVDRGALPAPEEVQGGENKVQEGPRTPIEELVEGLWCEVLGRTGVGSQDNFFESGGHSLLATRLVARIRAILGVEVSLRALFEAPTLAELAQRVEQTLRESEGIEGPPLVAVERPEEIPLSFAQQRLWFLDQLYPENTTYLNPGVLRLRGVLNINALERSLQELVCRHEILRTTFAVREGQPLQVIHSSFATHLPVVDLRGLKKQAREEVAEQLAKQESQRPCDLAAGPLLRTHLLQLENQEHVMLPTLHHIITDGWSTGVLVRELTTLYRAFVTGQPSLLAPLPIQYADYALWQRQWLQGEILQRHIAYWRHQLEGACPLELPTDAPRTAMQSDRGARYSFVLPTELSAQLVSLSRREGVTLFMTLLAAFQVLLYRLTDQTDIVVGTDVANRTYVETEGLIGFFVNLLALRTDVQRSSSFRNMLQYVRAMLLGAYAHQELPFELVVEHLQSERRGRQTPLVQVLFVLQNTSRSALSLPGIELETISSESTASKFDLALFLQEGSEDIRGSVVYRTELFEEQTIATWMRRLEAVLRNVVVKPDTSVDDLEISTDEEKTEQASTEKELYKTGSTIWRSKKSKALDLSEFHSLLIGQENE